MDSDSGPDPLESGREALRQLDWRTARTAFEAALKIEEIPAALEGLADACSWLHDEQGALGSRERAFQLYLRQGDRAAAARTAVWLANDLTDFRGAAAVANGWVQRARRLLEGLDPVPEHAWLALWDAVSALIGGNDTASARQFATRAGELAHELRVFDVEITAMAIEGLALVSEGEIARGMELLDEAAAVAVGGEIENASMRTMILCSLMDACDRVRDFDRASQWCTRIQEVSERWGTSEVFSVCRPHYAVVLTWRGAWQEAEAELTAAVRELSAIRPPMAVEGVIRLAELRVLQGRYEDAATLFVQAEHEPLAQLGRARLSLIQGDAAMAIELAERFLRRIPVEDRIERVPGLELLVHADVAAGRPESAQVPVAELRMIADMVGTAPLRAAACASDGLLAAARGDHETARRAFEEAVDRYGAAGAPFETARTRLELAGELSEAGLSASALRETEAALTALIELGAAGEAERARGMMAALVSDQTAPADPHRTSLRQVSRSGKPRSCV